MKRHKYDECDLWLLEVGEKAIRFHQAVEELSSAPGMTYDGVLELAEGISKLTGHHISECLRFLYAQREVMRK